MNAASPLDMFDPSRHVEFKTSTTPDPSSDPSQVPRPKEAAGREGLASLEKVAVDNGKTHRFGDGFRGGILQLLGNAI